MSTTDQRTGFRLPWSTDQRTQSSLASPAEPDAPSPTGDLTWPTADASDPTATPEATPSGTAPATPRRVNPLLAELTKAMHAAAEASRSEALARLGTEATERIEGIHALAADEATGLKKHCDEDVSTIREWCKAELARIRDEADRRTAERRSRLETEMERHAALVERRIERVRGQVATFEAAMAGFFETLLTEDDPTRVALLAEQMPEAPALDAIELDDVSELDANDFDAEGPSDIVVATAGPDVTDEVDLSLSPEGAAAAEAEALAGAVAEGDASTTGSEAEDAIAARLAGKPTGPAEGTTRTELVVTGLVSVASIAAFKRAVSRVPGVGGVGVTSGPDGEFLFAVDHEPAADLAAALSTLGGFDARLTGVVAGALHVTARDRDGDA